jgi:hypothetical protein
MDSEYSDYIIAIPSYKRHIMLKDKTLKILQRYKITSDIIFIFVANKDEYKLYKKTIPSTLYNRIIIGKKGLKNQRNFISNYFDENSKIVQLDDDITKIYKLSQRMKTKKKTKHYYFFNEINNLDKFIRDAFRLCQKENSFLWGVYPLPNAFFMTQTISLDLRFIAGPMWGMINRKTPSLKSTIDEKEDVERTIKYYLQDKKVIRFNYVAFETNYYTNIGGMQIKGKDRKKEAMKSAIYLHKKYPNVTKIRLTKKSGVPEIKLINLINSNNKKFTRRKKTLQ